MNRCNPDNERIKRRYERHLREAEGLSEKTIDHARRAIADFEAFTLWQPFKRFSDAQALAFKRRLLAGPGKRSAESNARTTIHSKLIHLEKFFSWLAEEPGFRTAFRIADAKFFKLPRRERSIASERQPKPAPTVEQVQRAIRSMPASTDVELRNRALIACLLLTGARVAALSSLKLRHVMPNRLGIHQDACDVRTKGAKTFPTYFFPVGDDIREMFLAYIDHLRDGLGWNDNDPLFPSTRQDVGEDHQFAVVGLERKHWKTADPVRAIFRAALDAAELPHYSPHSIRRTLVSLGQELCQTPMEFKAWSQNLGHEQVLTTFTSYGAVSDLRQSQILAGLGSPAPRVPDDLASLFSEFVSWRKDHSPIGNDEGVDPCRF